MKAKTFENLIRKIVREEIDYALRREIKSLKEDIHEGLNSTLTEYTKKEVKTPQQDSLKEEVINNVVKKPRRKLNFTSNTALNDLLNETAMGDTNLNSGHSPVSMEGSFTPSGVGNMPMEAVPEVVADAVNRDYSDLMKAIDKKRQ